MVVLDNSIIQDFEQICSTFLKIFKLYLLDTPTFIIEPILSAVGAFEFLSYGGCRGSHFFGETEIKFYSGVSQAEFLSKAFLYSPGDIPTLCVKHLQK